MSQGAQDELRRFQEVDQTIPFTARLSLLAKKLNNLSKKPENENSEFIRSNYKNLADAVRQLQKFAEKGRAEVSETGASYSAKDVVFTHKMRLILEQPIEKQLASELINPALKDIFNDGDTANLAKQITAFTAKLRAYYGIRVQNERFMDL